jgi:KEOPS complex subunit Cgi121
VTFKGDLVGAWERRAPPGGAKALMDDVLAEAAASGSQALVLDGDLVFGADHIASALHHAAKAIAEGRNASDSIAMETLLYASGERQLSGAIRKMAVGEGTRRVVLAVLSGGFRPGEGWSPLPPSEGAADRARLARFGVTEAEMSTVAEGRLAELVLERVASVDVTKR